MSRVAGAVRNMQTQVCEILSVRTLPALSQCAGGNGVGGTCSLGVPPRGLSWMALGARVVLSVRG